MTIDDLYFVLTRVLNPEKENENNICIFKYQDWNNHLQFSL